MGENGAGKSTLLKILSGSSSADSGQVLIDGAAVHLRSAGDASGLGIAMIHQELNLIPQMSVADNLFLGREHSRFGVLARARMRQETTQWLERVGASHIDPQQEAGSLSIGRQQLIEIATA